MVYVPKKFEIIHIVQAHLFEKNGWISLSSDRLSSFYNVFLSKGVMPLWIRLCTTTDFFILRPKGSEKVIAHKLFSLLFLCASLDCFAATFSEKYP